ncbi:MAG TPA: hypothetical protein VFN67_43025 [Polyangiales bacterium]|nr:hypothetical protein [Polyangiales bacterium]
MKRSQPCAHVRWLSVIGLALTALYPVVSAALARTVAGQRLARLHVQVHSDALDPAVVLRMQHLSPLLASWETIGGCGAGGSAGVGTVKWIGRSTTGGLFQNVTQANYIPYRDGYNLTVTNLISREIDDRWSVGVLVPFIHRRYNNYLELPLDITNTGFGDVSFLGTYKFGSIRDTALTATLGFPTGTHSALFRNDPLTQEKQLGAGQVTGSLMLDHTLDQTWGLITLGGMASWRGGENDLGNYRAPFASVYGYAGYFLGPFVPSLGLALSGFAGSDRNRGVGQTVPLVLASANAGIEWSNDWIALLLGVSLPIGLYYDKSVEVDGEKPSIPPTGIQPWTASLGVSVSPF